MAEHPEPEEVMAWVDGQAGEAGPAVERHLRVCAQCRALADDIRSVSGQLAQWTLEPRTFDMPVPRSGRTFQWRWVAMAALLVAGLFAWSWFGSAPQAPIQSAAAPVVIEVFIDWQCPICLHLEYEPMIEALQKEQPGRVQYVVRDYPLNQRCNSAIKGEPHAAACEAAAAVRMARDRGKSPEFIGWIMTNQKTMTPESVKAQARLMLGVDNFDAEYAKKLEEIGRDVSASIGRNVRFTPAVFVNGVRVGDAEGQPPTPADLEKLIQAALNRRER